MNKKKKEQITLEGQMLPADLELEQIVLGSILIDGNSINQVSKDFSENLFYYEKNKLIAESILSLYRDNKPIDLITVSTDLHSKNKLELVGGAYEVTILTSKVTGSSNIDYYVKILQQKALERNLIYICNNTLSKLLQYKDDVFDVYSNTQVEIESALKDVMKYEIKGIKDIHYDIVERNLNIIQKGIKSGVPSGLRNLDNVTNGWQKSDLIILAGRPASGKTATAVSMIMHPVLEQKIPIAIFSLEMSAFQLGGRIQSYLTGINVSKIIKGQLNMQEAMYINEECTILDNSPLYIDDTPNISLIELKSKSRKLVKEKGVQLIVIDYLQLMRSGLDIKNREQEIAEISKGLKGLAKELNIPVIALSQLSRLVEGRTDKKPILSDLRESGQIEADADMVIFTYRPEYYGIEQYEVGNQTFDGHGLMMLLVSKHRNGELGEIPLRFIHEQAKVDNYNSADKNNVDTNKNSTFVTIKTAAENNDNFLNETPF